MYRGDMEWLNYHHLFYFWTVAREGSITRASGHLRLAQPTISGQIRALEEALGHKLFARSGRGLVLTEAGRLVYGFADEIFTLGREMIDALRGRAAGRPARFRVGVADVLPKAVAYQLIEPALKLAQPVQLVCREDGLPYLLADLALHRLDIVLSDSPVEPGAKVRAFSHLLGECGASFFGTPALASKHRRGFPGSLDGAPFLLPGEKTSLRRSLEQWFATTGVQPRIVGEFDDFSLMRTFGERGAGIFAAPSVVETEMRKVPFALIGRAESLRGRFYAVSMERKLRDPAVLAVCNAARARLFAPAAGQAGKRHKRQPGRKPAAE